MMKSIYIFCLVIFFSLGTHVFAATNDFIIRVMGGEDTTPPTTPTLLSVTPIAATQIDIDWDVSTDDYLLGGYVLLRDGLPLSTTTLTSYSDTGLTPETLYSYEVYAFDSAGNISTTSNALSTTTLAVPPESPPPVTSGGSESTQTVTLRDFRLETTQNTADLFWETSLPSRYALRWGRTDAYLGGYVLSEVYQRVQQTSITDLEPGVLYRYELVAYTPANIAVVLRSGEFTTEPGATAEVVPNVTRLEASVLGNGVTLSYTLPDARTDISVRVVRNHLGYPTDIYDGISVYQGTLETVTDPEAFTRHGIQYYTVFVVTAEGVISSGAIVMVTKPTSQTDDASVTTSSSTATTAPVVVAPPVVLPEIPLFGLEASAITITQANQRIDFMSEAVELSYVLPFTISIPFEAVPPYLKAIIVTIIDPTDQRRSYSFLLRLNNLGTAYEATVAPLNVVGSSRIQVEIFDFERLLIGRYRLPVSFVVTEVNETVVFFPDTVVNTFRAIVPYVLSLVGIFGFIFFLILRRSKQAEDKR